VPDYAIDGSVGNIKGLRLINMKRQIGLSLSVALMMMVAPPCVQAQDTEDGFRVVASSLNAESERAEICLVLSQPIDVKARAVIAASIQLEKDGTKITVAPGDLSLTPHDLCIQQLDHRHEYRLTIKKLRSRNGAKLEEPVNLVMTIPGRKPSLAFVEPAQASKLPRLNNEKDKKALLVRALNVKSAQVTLYRIEDRKTFAEAMQQIAQLSRAPTESLYFATHKGRNVWQSELVFKDMPDIEQELETPMPSGKELPPGFYFFAIEQRAKTGATPTLMAGQWFRVSKLSLTAITTGEGVYVFARQEENRSAPGIPLQMVTPDGRPIAESVSSAEGMAMLARPQDNKDKPAYITGISAAGDVDIIDLTQIPEKEFAFSARETSMELDRPVYQSGSIAAVTLLTRDEEGRLKKAPPSALKFLRPDFSLASEQPVPNDRAEVLTLTIPLPNTAKADEWHLLWQQTDGTVLGEKPLRLSPDGTWPKIEVTASREMLDADGKITLNVKAIDDHGKPLAWRGGKVTARPSRPSFTAWKNYRFGVEAPDEDSELKGSNFMTNNDGTATVHLKAKILENVRAQAVTFKIMLDGSAEPAAVTLPVENPGGWIGIKLVEENRPVAEKGKASFALLALDSNLKRRALSEVYYHVYEEGRNFEWYQDEGRWQYRPLPQHRRVSGGKIAVPNDGAIVEVPVTAGNYVMEITDDEGNILAQHAFRSGWDKIPLESQNEKDLVFENISTRLEPKRDNKIKMKLARPTMVSVMIGNGRVRQTAYRFMKAGEQTIDVTPTEEWKVRGQVMARAVFEDNSVATATLPLSFRHPAQDLEIALTAPPRLVTGTTESLPITVQNMDKREKTYVAAQLIPLVKEDKTVPASITLPPTALDNEGRATLRMLLPSFSGAARLVMRAWNGKQYGEKTITIPSEPGVVINGEPLDILAAGDRAALTVTIENNRGAEGVYAYELKVPDGSRLEGQAKGEMTLKRGQNRTLVFNIAAEKESRDNIRLEIKGPGNFYESRSWPLTIRADSVPPIALTMQQLDPSQKSELPLGETKSGADKKDENTLVLIAPVPLPELPRHGLTLLRAEPFTTEELAHWLEATKAGKEEIRKTGLISEDALKHLRDERRDDLEKRQNDDGGFSMWPSPGDANGASDMGSTAAAVMALREEAPQAAQSAARWLQKQLENTWFEESERPARASAFLALVKAGRADMSALRYLADTSKDKEMVPTMMAEIAQALAEGGDDEAAQYWLEKAHKALADLMEKTNPEAWSLLQKMAENKKQDLKKITETYEQAIKTLLPETLEQTIALWRTSSAFLKSAGEWEIVVGGQEKKQQGILPVMIAEKNIPVKVENNSSSRRYVLQVKERKEDKEGTEESASRAKKRKIKMPVMQVERQIYRLDGTPIGPETVVSVGETCVVLVHGSGRLDEISRMMPLVVISPATSGLRLMQAGNMDASVVAASWPWLPGPMTGIEGASVTPSAATFAFQPSNDWRLAFLLKTERPGTFVLPPVTLRDLSGNKLGTPQSPLRLQVR